MPCIYNTRSSRLTSRSASYNPNTEPPSLLDYNLKNGATGTVVRMPGADARGPLLIHICGANFKKSNVNITDL